MYNTTYKVPSNKTDWVMVTLWLAVTVAACFTFAKALDGHGHRALAKPVATKYLKG